MKSEKERGKNPNQPSKFNVLCYHSQKIVPKGLLFRMKSTFTFHHFDVNFMADSAKTVSGINITIIQFLEQFSFLMVLI